MGKKDELIEAKRTFRTLDGRDILIIHHQGAFFAMDSYCYREYRPSCACEQLLVIRKWKCVSLWLYPTICASVRQVISIKSQANPKSFFPGQINLVESLVEQVKSLFPLIQYLVFLKKQDKGISACKDMSKSGKAYVYLNFFSVKKHKHKMTTDMSFKSSSLSLSHVTSFKRRHIMLIFRFIILFWVATRMG